MRLSEEPAATDTRNVCMRRYTTVGAQPIATPLIPLIRFIPLIPRSSLSWKYTVLNTHTATRHHFSYISPLSHKDFYRFILHSYARSSYYNSMVVVYKCVWRYAQRIPYPTTVLYVKQQRYLPGIFVGKQNMIQYPYSRKLRDASKDACIPSAPPACADAAPRSDAQTRLEQQATSRFSTER